MRRIPALLLLTLAIAVVLAAPALAHTEMSETSPAAGAVEAAGGRSVTVTFTQEVDHRLASVTVRRDGGAVVSEGKLQRDGLALMQPVAPLTTGRYEVQWRAAAADGHILKGTFPFRVEPDGAEGSSDEVAGAEVADAEVADTEVTERLSPADLLREHAKGNYDHGTPSYAVTADEPTPPDEGATTPAAAAAEEPPPARDNGPMAIVALLAAALSVTLVTVGLESIRASRV